MRFWVLFIVLSPVLLWQARRTRVITPRLPEAKGDAFGLAGPAGHERLRLLVAGESTAAGVGVQYHHQGLAAQIAAHLRRRHGRPVHWHTIGLNGARAADLVRHLRKQPGRRLADLVIISLGVNDTVALTSPRRYRRELDTLIATLREQCPGAPIHLLAVPPMQHFTALPAPLRQLLGLRAARLDREQQRLCRNSSKVHHVAFPLIDASGHLAEDGYHPSSKGYQYIGEQVANRL